MKVAQVCPRYHPYIGGVETHVRELSERLVERGYEVDVLTTDPTGTLPKEEEINGVTVRRFRSWAPNEAYYFSRSLKSHLARYSRNYNIVHAHSYHAFPALYAAQTKCLNRLVFTPHYHGTGHTFFRRALHIPYRCVARAVFDNADKTICVSNFEKHLVMRDFGLSNEDVAVIPNGIDLKEFANLKKRENDHKVILYVGRLEKYKGIDYLIRALHWLGNEFILEIVGSGPHREDLLRLIDNLGVKDRVKFFQNLPRDELLQKYADADVFALLSEHEAYGISVAEALAAGTPCIVANTSALSEWIDGENCYGVGYPINVEELAHLISSVAGKKIDALTLQLPTWDVCAEKIIEIYDRLTRDT
ncbi:MAG: glycosyltransferase family 4 protein [Candidatus Methanosuratincola petrocarbonis]